MKFITALFVDDKGFKKWDEVPYPPPKTWVMPIRLSYIANLYSDEEIRPDQTERNRVHFRLSRTIMFKDVETALYEEEGKLR